MMPRYDTAASAKSTTEVTQDWNEHWNAFALMTARNPAQAYRRKLVFEHLALERFQGPVRLLDLGSGTGELAKDVLRCRAEASVLGLDCSPSGVDSREENGTERSFHPTRFHAATVARSRI